MSNANKPIDPVTPAGFDISLFSRPFAEVKTSTGTLHLFPLRTTDLEAFKHLNSSSSVERIRQFLPCIASLSAEYGWDYERVGLTQEQVTQLTDHEIEALAKAYAAFPRFSPSHQIDKVEKIAGEEPSDYLNRLLRIELENNAKQEAETRAQILKLTDGSFATVIQASQALGDTLREFERQSRASLYSPPTPSYDVHISAAEDVISTRNEQRSRERAEELNTLRQTAKMTAQSAALLKELAMNASVLLSRLDQRDQEAKRTTQRQLWIAVGSLLVSAVLAWQALQVSKDAYRLDRENIASSETWQSSVLKKLQESHQKSAHAQANQNALLQTVEQLRAQVSELESRLAKSEAVHSKSPN